jgi:preprotein translocase SecE subunit
MAKKDIELSTPSIEVPAKEQKKNAGSKNGGKKNTPTQKANAKKRRSIGRYFRDIISELKKVNWAKFKSTKESKGVWEKTGTVLLIVFIFIILITAMDLGLSELLGLLIKAGA